jgi:antitoxin component YwqK of YwqJK toxin-antitoxin module
VPVRKAKSGKYIHYHKDGSVWARGQFAKGKMSGFWVWFRKDGTKMRSGSFENGRQAGKWTTYDRKGKVYKVTVMKPGGKSR